MTKANQAPKYHTVPCPGEAHRNPFIDNCMICAPAWGKIVIPVECVDLDAWERLSDAQRASHKRARKAFAKTL